MITSRQNPRVKWVRMLQASSRERSEAGVFVIEGVRLAEEALRAGWEAKLVLFSQDLSPRGVEAVQGFVERGAPAEQATPEVLAAASDTQHPQGVLAVLGARSLPLPQPLGFALVPDGVRDPGNLGSMLRSAAAAGAQAVLLPPGAVDAFSPKVLRAGMGAHFRLPVVRSNWEQVRQALAGLQVYLASSGGGLPYTQVDFRLPFALIVGGEAEGAGSQAESLASQHVHIPMPGGVESLNAAAAAAVLLFEAARQRGESPKQ